MHKPSQANYAARTTTNGGKEASFYGLTVCIPTQNQLLARKA
jgi:hypothetical protein